MGGQGGLGGQDGRAPVYLVGPLLSLLSLPPLALPAPPPLHPRPGSLLLPVPQALAMLEPLLVGCGSSSCERSDRVASLKQICIAHT